LLSAPNVALVAVVSQPAKPKGRGQQMIDPPVATFAKEKNLELLQPLKASSPDFLETLRALKPDIIVTAAYGQILSDDFLAIPKRGTINIHPSKLPKYRGAIPVAAALLNNDSHTAISVLFTVRKLDAGNIIVQQDYPIPHDATTESFTRYLFQESGPLLLEAIARCTDSNFTGTPQNENEVSHCKKIDKEDGKISWSDDAESIFNKYRAYTSWPGIYTFMKNERVNLFDCAVCSLQAKLSAGEITYDKPSKCLIVGTREGCLAVRHLQRAGSKKIDATSFWNGLKDKTGARFE